MSPRTIRPHSRGDHGPSSSGGRGHLPRPRTGLASRQCRPREPWPDEGDERDRELPHGGSRRPCRALRGLLACRHRLQLLPQSALSQVPGLTGARMAGGAQGRAAGRPLLPRRVHLASADRRHRLPEQDRHLRLLFKASSETLRTIAADPKRLGVRIGFTSVLHTWGSTMTHHPHVHMIVPGGGISLDGTRWIGCRPNYLLPVKVLSRLFRRLMLEMLLAAHDAGRLQFFGDHAHLAGKAAFKAYLAPLHRTKWFVHSKRPLAGPEQVLAYLSRYTHR